MKQNINIFDKKERKKHENAMTRDGQAKYTDTRNMFHYKKAGRRPALQIQGKHPMTRDGQTKYTNTRNMIHYERKLVEGQLPLDQRCPEQHMQTSET